MTNQEKNSLKIVANMIGLEVVWTERDGDLPSSWDAFDQTGNGLGNYRTGAEDNDELQCEVILEVLTEHTTFLSNDLLDVSDNPNNAVIEEG